MEKLISLGKASAETKGEFVKDLDNPVILGETQNPRG